MVAGNMHRQRGAGMHRENEIVVDKCECEFIPAMNNQIEAFLVVLGVGID